MAVDVNGVLRGVLGQLETERTRIEHQLSALKTALGPVDGSSARRPHSTMSADQRAAVSRRMKAYWAKRRAAKR